jgi:CRISPR-associated endonuclease/helicase Cas3
MGEYSEDFVSLTGKGKPYPYQERVAEHIFARRHLIVRAPTGAGKTLATLAPFLLGRNRVRCGGMIYVLPLRSLVEAVFEEAVELAVPRGFTVAMQTGERADAEFFHNADIIVTTFDQLLSGLLCDPYGLSRKLWNINAAAIAGKLVVFDEFHLMEPDRAFASAVFGVELFKELCVTVWMTATATSGLTRVIKERLSAVEVELSQTERTALFEGRGISRALRTHWEDKLTHSEVGQYRGCRVLVVVNTVGRAQQLFEQIPADWHPLLLHSRFFSDHRTEKQKKLKSADLVIATQVIEAGVDISSDVLLTEVAPVNAIIQRAGRCARFKNESGVVHVYGVPSRWPYEDADLRIAQKYVVDTDSLNPQTSEEWVEGAHAAQDHEAMAGFHDLADKRVALMRGRVTGDGDSGAAAYIRRGDDTVRVFILNNPLGVKPQARQAIQLRRKSLQQFRSQAWAYDGDEWQLGADIRTAYAIALPPSIACYTEDLGLKLGISGVLESPCKEPKKRPGWCSLRAESWVDHTRHVIEASIVRLAVEGFDDSFAELVRWTAKLHDLGKLQDCWQRWAHERQACRGTEVSGALAHTDYDYKLHRGEARPPRHAAASALYGVTYLDHMSDWDRTSVLLAVLAHHGGTIGGVEAADKLHASSTEALHAVKLPIPKASRCSRFRADVADTIALSFNKVWPLTAILSRILRLSDQKATAESGNEQ